MKRIVLVLAILIYMGITWAAPDFTATNETSLTMEAGDSNVFLNFTVNNGDATENITQVNFTLPNVLTFISGSNGTSANAVFYNTTSNLTWENTTVLIENGTLERFWFNVSVGTTVGSYNITITVANSTGGTNQTNISITVQDTTPPSVTIISPTNTTYSNSNLVINTSVTDIVGVGAVIAEINGTVNVTLQNQPGTNYWNATYTFSDGSNTIRIYANDTSGNVNSTETVTFTVDTTPPTITIYSPQNLTYTSSSVDLNVSANEAINTWWYSLDGGANTTFVPNITLTGLTDGQRQVIVYANDSVGNVGTNSVYFTVDANPPAVNYIPPTQDDHANLSQDWAYVNVSVSDAVSAIHTCLLEFNSSINYTMTFVNTSADNKTGYCWFNVTGLNEGTHNYSVYVNDTQGNLNQTSLRHITLDVTPPVVTFITPVANANLSGTVYVNVTVADPTTGAQTVQFYNGSQWFNMTLYEGDINNGNWTYAWDTTKNADTTGLVIQVNATDYATNTGTASQTVNVDNTAPVISVSLNATNINIGDSVLINATITDNVSGLNVSSVRIKVNGSDLPVTNNSPYFTAIYTANASGNFNVNVTAYDNIGNLGYNDSQTIVVGTPSITLVQPENNATLITPNVTFSFVAVDPVYSTLNYTLYIDGIANTTGTATSGSTTQVTVYGLANGTHNWSVTIINNANVQNSSETRNFTVITEIINSTTIPPLPANSTNSSGIITTPIGNVEYIITTNGTTPAVNVTVVVEVTPPAGVATITQNLSGALPNIYVNISVNDTTWYNNISVIQMRLYYNASQLPSNVPESTLRPARFTNGTWVRLDCSALGCPYTLADGTRLYASGVNTSGDYVWANLSHFSVYGIAGTIVAAAAPSAEGGVYSPVVTILANSIDLSLATEFIEYLEEVGIKVYLVDKNNFSSYNKKLYIIILGGPEAYEGVGEIVSEILTEEEKNQIKQDKAWIKKKSIYRVGQVVYVLAGKNREATAEVWKENKEEIRKIIEYNWG